MATRYPEQVYLSEYITRPATIEDAHLIAALCNTWGQKYYDRDTEDVADIRRQFDDPEWNAETSTCMVFDGAGMLVGFAEVWDTHPTPVHPHIWVVIHPDIEEFHAVGELLYDWGKHRARQAIERVPEDVRFVLETDTDPIDSQMVEVIKAAGFAPKGQSWALMVREFADDEAIEEPQWADGITVTTAESFADKRAIFEAANEAFRDHRGYVEQDMDKAYELWLERLARNEDHDPSLWFLAMDGDQIAGVSLSKAKSRDFPDQGYVNTLGVVPAYRRRGIAGALLLHTFRELQKRGKQGVNLHVDDQSITGATRVYRRAGMERELGYDTYIIEVRPGRELSAQ